MHRISRALGALVLAAGCLSAQRLTWYEKLLLMQGVQTLSGMVVDESGKPVSDAHFDHSDNQFREQLFSDELGRFKLLTRAPAVVVRKLGYSGQLIHINGDTIALRVVLHRATQTLPACRASCRTLETKSSKFCFPEIPGVGVSEQGRDEDTYVRAFTAQSPNRSTELLHGAGSTWSLGIPYTGDVWESAQYSERSFTGNASDVVDARGTGPDDRSWRFLGRFGESASYYEADPAAAALLDKVLDGVCLKTN